VLSYSYRQRNTIIFPLRSSIKHSIAKGISSCRSPGRQHQLNQSITAMNPAGFVPASTSTFTNRASCLYGARFCERTCRSQSIAWTICWRVVGLSPVVQCFRCASQRRRSSRTGYTFTCCTECCRSTHDSCPMWSHTLAHLM